MKSLVADIWKSSGLQSLLAPLFKLVETLLELCVPLLIAKMIDAGIRAHELNVICNAGRNLFLICFVSIILAASAQYWAAKSASRLSAQLRSQLYSAYLNKSAAEIELSSKQEILTRLNSDSYLVQNGVNMILRLLLRSPFVVFGAAYMAYRIDARISLLFALTIVLLLGLISYFSRRSILDFFKIQLKLEKLTRILVENFEGRRIFRALNRQELEEKRFDSVNQSSRQVAEVCGKRNALLAPTSFLLINLALLAVLFFGRQAVLSKRLEAGEVLALSNYMSAILVEALKLVQLMLLISKAVAAHLRIKERISDPERPEQRSKADRWEQQTPMDLDVRDLAFRYPDAPEYALQGINFHLRPGTSLGIIGGTGSGKSTLVQVIAGLLPPSSGEILIDGHNLKELSWDGYRESIAYAAQRVELFQDSLRQNLLLFDESAGDEELLAALKASDSLAFIEAKEGLDTEVESGGSNFSGGQRQRLNLARALLKKSRLLILDDISSALDYETEMNIGKGIKSLRPNVSRIRVAQRASSLLDCDQILVLENGRQVALGSHQELLAKSALYREIFETQFPKTLSTELLHLGKEVER
ncbi:MAG: ABC transporter ATP-binding protein [Eubacteriales bacterium]|nr:ABC transporter ATP-binding protein [Eubacteriales bacterium]